MRKAREAKAKAEAETAERARAWAKAKDNEKADIARLDDEAREKANTVNGAAVDASTKIRDSSKIQGAKR